MEDLEKTPNAVDGPKTVPEPVDPDKPAKPKEPKPPADPDMPVKPKKPKPPADPDMPAKPKKPKPPADPDMPAKPKKPKPPADPDMPAKPKKAKPPADPDMPAKPKKPRPPADPDMPAKPKKPMEPEVREPKETVLSVRDVHISYRVVRPISLKRFFGTKRQEKARFEAVRGVSFDMHRGEIVGMIGKNGSGKSTLLRAVANIYSPDSGSIETYGRSVGLMAIGVGFVNELSGRDNIYLSGLLMGFKKQEIEAKIDEIIEFADIGDFIDAPVRSYSSGMHSKLAFSITAIMETDIMLVDETLSVGDARFRKKSEKKMKQLIRDENKTVLIVSHSASILRDLCQRLIWLDDGVIRMDGKTDEVLAAYQQYMDLS